MSIYSDAVELIAVNKASVERAKQKHAEEMQALEAQITSAQKIVNAAEAGESAEVFAAGALYLQINWGDPRYGAINTSHFFTPEVESAFDSLMAALRTNNALLLKNDAAVKHYDAWLSQNETWCEHGLGPRHGSLWFRAGLRPGWAADKPHEYVMPPTEEDRLLCIQYIKAIIRRPELL